MKQLPTGSPPLAGFKLLAPAPALQTIGRLGTDLPSSYPLALPARFAPSLASKHPKPRMPMSSFIELEYYCAPSRGVPMTALAWEPARAAEIALPCFSLKAITPSVEQVLKEKQGPPPPVEVFPIIKPKISALRLFVRYGP